MITDLEDFLKFCVTRISDLLGAKRNAFWVNVGV